MDNINFGIAKNIVATRATDGVLNNSINESQEITNDFLNVIKESPVLMVEFEIYSNIEGKNIDSTTLATRYVEKNIELLKEWSVDEINEAHLSLVPFVLFETVDKISNSKEVLYNSIHSLITKSGINEEHEAIENIVNYLKYNKENEEVLTESILNDVDSDNVELVIEHAVKLFNEKYKSLTEGEQMVLNLYVNDDIEGRKKMFEDTKIVVRGFLSESETSRGYDDKINETIAKIDEMEYDENTFVKNISKLNALKDSLS